MNQRPTFQSKVNQLRFSESTLVFLGSRCGPINLLSPPPTHSKVLQQGGPFHEATHAKPPCMGECVIFNSFTSIIYSHLDFGKVCMTFFHLLVLGITSVRIVHRWRTKRMWWDDYGAFVSLIVDVIYVILMWLRFRYGGKRYCFVPQTKPINVF